MTSFVVQLLDGFFYDVTARCRPGLMWTATAAEVLLTVHVRPAGRTTMWPPLDDDGLVTLVRSPPCFK